MEQNGGNVSPRYGAIEDGDIEVISALAQQYLTHGEYVQDVITREVSRHNYYGVKVLDGDKIIGFFTYKEGVDFTTPHPALEQKIRSLTADGVVFTVDGAFVDSAYRRRGISAEMMRQALSAMRAMGVKYLLTESWIHPDGRIPALHTPDSSLNMVYTERVERFYRNLPRYGMSCPICGENCQCGALIRLFSLD